MLIVFFSFSEDNQPIKSVVMMVIDTTYHQSLLQDWTPARYRAVKTTEFGRVKAPAVFFDVNIEREKHFLVVVFASINSVRKDVVGFRDDYGADLIGYVSFSDSDVSSFEFLCTGLGQSPLHE